MTVELSLWTVWFLVELCVVSTLVSIVVGWQGSCAVKRLMAERPPPSPPANEPRAAEVEELEESDVDSVDDGRPAQLRAKVRRSIEQVDAALESTSEGATQTSSVLMSLMEKLASTAAEMKRFDQRADLPADLRQASNELHEYLGDMDALLSEAQRLVEQMEAGLQICCSETAQYGTRSGFEWEALRPSPRGLTRLLRQKSRGTPEPDPGIDAAIPPALADAIDQALI
ncbi:MAG: hypothetical protein ACFB9M_17685 [Myxococcota bacterium]